MKFSADTSVLLEALRTAGAAVPSKSTLQILNNFLLRLEGNFLEVSATDLDLGIRLSVEVEGEQDGSVVVNAGKLLEILKAQPGKGVPLTFTVEDYLVKLETADGFSAEITGFDAMEYPQFPELEDGSAAQITGAELEFLAEKTSFAVSSDATRLSLNGVFCQQKDQKMLFVATDGHRLGKAFLDHEGEDWEQGVILPPKVLSNIQRMVSEDTLLDFRIDDKYALFMADNLQVVSKIIEGPYPKYENVIPAAFERTAQVGKEKFVTELTRVASIANSRTRQIRLRIEGDVMIVSTRNPDIGGNTRGELPVVYSDETVFEIGFNASYLLEILRKCPSDDVLIKMNSPVGACVIEPIGEGMDFFFLLMPLRLPD